MITSSGYVAQVDDGLCHVRFLRRRCHFAAISVNNGFPCIDPAAYMGFGACVAHCPHEAISLERDFGRDDPLEIQKLMACAAQWR